MFSCLEISLFYQDTRAGVIPTPCAAWDQQTCPAAARPPLWPCLQWWGGSDCGAGVPEARGNRGGWSCLFSSSQGRSNGNAPKHGQPPCPALFSLSPRSGLQLSLLLLVLSATQEGEALQSEVGLIYCSLARRWILKQCICS